MHEPSASAEQAPADCPATTTQITTEKAADGTVITTTTTTTTTVTTTTKTEKTETTKPADTTK